MRHSPCGEPHGVSWRSETFGFNVPLLCSAIVARLRVRSTWVRNHPSWAPFVRDHVDLLVLRVPGTAPAAGPGLLCGELA